MSRILIHEPRQIHEDWPALLSGKAREIVVCADRQSLVTCLGERRPDVLIYVLSDLASDLVLLTTLRRVTATLPFILLDGPMDLETRRSIQELKPTYYGVYPLEGSELSDAVRGALHRTAN